MIKVMVDGMIYASQRHGGINRYFTELLRHLSAYADHLRIFFQIPAGSGDSMASGPHIIPFREWNLRPRRLWAHLTRRISQGRIHLHSPHLFHSTYYTSPPWDGLKQVVTVHDMLHETYPTFFGDPLLQDMKRRLIESAESIIAVSQATKTEILKLRRVPEEKITVIHHGPFLFSEDHSYEDRENISLLDHGIGHPFWLYVGMRGSYKNFGTLLRALPQVFSQVEGKLVAAGGGNTLETWQHDFLIRNRIEKKLVVLGFVKDDLLRQLYASAAALVIPSIAEGFGLPILEAMAAGTPVICSDIPVFHEVAGQAAIFFDPFNPEELAHKMIEVLNSDLRRTQVEKGLVQARRFSWEKTAAETFAVYRKVYEGTNLGRNQKRGR